MLTLKAKSIYNDFVGIKVADFILTITLYIDKCLSLTTAIVSDRFSFAEENIMRNNDLISREALKKAFKNKGEGVFKLSRVIGIIDNAPTVETQKVPIAKGHGDLIDKQEAISVLDKLTLGKKVTVNIDGKPFTVCVEEIGTDEDTWISKYEAIDELDALPTIIPSDRGDMV